MPMRRTIGMSLACLVISAGAVAKAPEKAASHRLFHKAQAWTCGGSHTRHAAHRGRSEGNWAASSDTDDDLGAGPPDAYLSAVQTVGPMQVGAAAWYNWVGARTASGEILDSVTATAAHRTLPLASYARVTNLDTGRSVIVKINDRGPWHRRFIIDLSPKAAATLGVIRSGVAAVTVEPVALGPAPTLAAYETAATPAMQ